MSRASLPILASGANGVTLSTDCYLLTHLLELLATYYLLLVLPLLPSPAILAIEAILTTTTFVTGATLTKTTFVTGTILYTWATLSTSPTDISLSTGVTQSRKNSS